jgi:hypothetical protein
VNGANEDIVIDDQNEHVFNLVEIRGEPQGGMSP